MFEHESDELVEDGRPTPPPPMTDEQLQRIMNAFGRQAKAKE
jgi:hypothetical protein